MPLVPGLTRETGANGVVPRAPTALPAHAELPPPVAVPPCSWCPSRSVVAIEHGAVVGHLDRDPHPVATSVPRAARRDRRGSGAASRAPRSAGRLGAVTTPPVVARDDAGTGE